MRALQDAIRARQDARLADELRTLQEARAQNRTLSHAIQQARDARGEPIRIARRHFTEPLTA
jgi:hypothetical protein